MSQVGWEHMRLEHLGDLRDVIQAGGGKLSLPAADPGDSRKPRGQE